MTTPTRSRIGVGVLVAGLTLGALTSPVAAKGGGRTARVERRGACTAGAVWKLKGRHDDGRIEVELEVDSNRVGQTWRVAVTDNGATVFAGTRRTTAPSGSFTVERRIADRPGTDVIRARATDTATGQRCSGSISL